MMSINGSYNLPLMAGVWVMQRSNAVSRSQMIKVGLTMFYVAQQTAREDTGL